MTNEIIQENDIDVKIIIKQFIEKHNNCFLKRIENNRYIKTLILVNTSFLPEFFDINTRIQYILRGIESPICCEICGNIVMKQIHGNSAKIYTACCPSCAHKTKDYLDKYNTTMERKYGVGVKNPMDVKEFRDKAKETDRRNHGGILFNQTNIGRKLISDRWDSLSDDDKRKIINKAIETNKLNHGGIHSSSLDETKDKYRKTISKRTSEDWQAIREHTRITLSEKYHGDYVNPSQVHEIKMKIQDTCEKRYGSREYFSSKDKLEKTIRTCQEKYGVDNYSSTEECREKVTNTCIDKYGVESYTQTNEYKERYTEIRKNCCKKWVLYWNDSGDRLVVRSSEYVDELKWEHKLQFDSSWEVSIFEMCKIDNSLECEYQPNFYFEYQVGDKTYTYHPDFLINGKLYEVKGDQFFRINESGVEEMYCPWKGNLTDEEYEFKCRKEEAKHQCMISNNVIILREHDIDNLSVDMFN